jgi:hypothetical protein
MEHLTWLDALWIGGFQVLALFPGVSRSGSTITGGMLRDLDRTSAARFSFLMAVPVMLAAGLVATLDLVAVPNFVSLLPTYLWGFLSAAVVGYLAIRWLLAAARGRNEKTMVDKLSGELLDAATLEAIVKRTRGGGGEIVKLMGTSAYWAPAAGSVLMAESIIKDKKMILPCHVILQGQYGIEGLFVGVPVKLGRNGVEEIVEFDLTDDEKAALKKSADHVKEVCDIVDSLG